MQKVSLTALIRQHLDTARQASAGRSSETLFGGHDQALRQTLIALVAGQGMDEHENPGEATLQVLQGRVRLETQDASSEASSGEHVVIPPQRHSLQALDDSVVLLTVAKLGYPAHPQ